VKCCIDAVCCYIHVCHGIAWSVCLSVCLSVSVLGTWVSCAKTPEPIMNQFGSDSCEPKEPCVDVVQIPHGKGQFWWGQAPAVTCMLHWSSLGTSCRLGQDVLRTIQQWHHIAAVQPVMPVYFDHLLYASVVLLNSSGVLHAGDVAVHFNKHRVAQKVYIFNTPYFWNRSRLSKTEFTKMFLEFWE